MECVDLPPFLFQRDRQLNSTQFNLSQGEEKVQREMQIFSETKRLGSAPVELVRMCEDELDAIRLCIQLSRFTHEYIGKELSIDKGHFSRIIQGQAGFPTHKRLALMRLCGNRAPVQYEVMQIGAGDTERSAPDEATKAENDRLKSEIAALKGALAAVLASPISSDRAAA